MSLPIYEIALVPASEAYKADQTIAKVGKAQWNQGSWNGFESEDPNLMFMVEAWASKEAFDNFKNSPDFHVWRNGALPGLAGPATVNFAAFTSDATGPLNAPATEFVTFTLKEGSTLEALLPLVKELVDQIAIAPVAHGSAWGPVLGNDKVYYGVLGWDTVQAHWDTVGKEPFVGILTKVKEIADIWLVHAHLKKL